jgi:hypothetical protein
MLVGVPLSLADPIRAADDLDKTLNKKGIRAICVPTHRENFSYTAINVIDVKKSELDDLIKLIKSEQHEAEKEHASTIAE